VKPRRSGRAAKPAAAKSPYRVLVALGLVGALGLAYAWNSVFLGPKGRQRAAVQKELASAQQQEKDLRNQLGQLKKLAADTQSREAELIRVGRLVPAEPDVGGAILALNDTATAAQVAWSTFVPTPAAPGAAGAPATLGVGMKVAGTFGQVFDYLARLETLDRLVVVDSIQLSGGPLPDGRMRIDADIKARMFAAGTGAAKAAESAASTGKAASPAATDPIAASGATEEPAGTAATAAALTKAGG
jgi:Tfp pilus assembly protein PilO